MSIPRPNSPVMISNRARDLEKLNAEQLRNFMNKHGISITELSEILGVTQQGIHLWLKGERVMSVTTSRLIRIMNKYPQLIKEF